MYGDIAYTSQDPWIQNMTLRDNVLFGRKYDTALYKETIRVCGLEPDLEVSASTCRSSASMPESAGFPPELRASHLLVNCTNVCTCACFLQNPCS